MIKGTRRLKISAPIPVDTHNIQGYSMTMDASTTPSPTLMGAPRSCPVPAVILISKFPFKAENRYEISVGVGEAFKLIERKGNGWIVVKPIGRLGDAGLIPASYVRIVSLDSQTGTKFDEQWLHRSSSMNGEATDSPSRSMTPTNSSHVPSRTPAKEMGKPMSTSEISSQHSDSAEEAHFSFQSTASSSTTAAPSPNPSKAPSPKNSIVALPVRATQIPTAVSALVKNADLCGGRYWYRVDVAMSDGKNRHLCRYYQDFYKLHCSMVDHLIKNKSSDEDMSDVIAKLPTLPDPIARPDLQTLESILLQRCQALNVYIFKLVQNKHGYDYGDVVSTWISPRHGDVEFRGDLRLSQSSIQDMMGPIPTNLSNPNTSLDGKAVMKPVLTIKTSVTPPLPALYSPQPTTNLKLRSTSMSSLSSQQTSASSPRLWYSPTMPSAPTFMSERSHSTSTIHEGQTAEFDDWLTSPVEPLLIPSAKRKSNNGRNGSISSVITQRQLGKKAKVYHQGDIFALKLKHGCQIDDIRASISRRLECGMDSLVLKYRSLVTEEWVRLMDDEDVEMAMDQEKLLIEVMIV